MVSPQQFSSYLRKPYDLDVSAEANLRSILQQHPYFSNAHLLLARSLHNQKSPAFDDALKQAAMFAGERPLLYKLVNIDEKEAAPLEKNFDSPAAITTAPTQQNEQPTVETTENTPADTYQAPEQVIAPTVEVAENIAAPEVEATEEHTETEEFVLPVAIEEPTTETVNEEQPEEDTIEYAQGIINNNRIRHLPVLNRNKVLVGLISIGDIIHTGAQIAKAENKYLRDYIEGNIK